MNKKEIVIVGAGISGLTLGTALAQSGWNVQILERSSELREIGAGLYTWENGLKVLESIGVYEKACTDVEFITSLNMMDEKLELINSTKFSEQNRFCVIPRQDIHYALTQAAIKSGVKIETNACVINADSSGIVTLEDGKTYKADLVVAADGVNSKVRNSLPIGQRIEEVRNGAIRAMIPKIGLDEEGLAMEHWSGYRRIGISPSTDQYRYVYLTTPSIDTEGLSTPFNKGAWLDSFPHLESVINRIDTSRLDSTFYYVYLSTWSANKVAILGDAAHAMEPNLGQGAGVSLSSALELANQLNTHDIDTALEKWEEQMKPVVDKTQIWSRIYGAAASNWPKELMSIRSEMLRKAMGSENVDLMMSLAARYVVDENQTIK